MAIDNATENIPFVCSTPSHSANAEAVKYAPATDQADQREV